MDETAELVLTGGKVITCTRDETIASAVAIRGEHIVAVGSVEEIRGHIGANTRVIELDGRALCPGLVDTHAHMDREGLKSLLPSLAGAESSDEICRRIAALAATTSADEWIVTMPPGHPPHFRSLAGDGKAVLPDRWMLDEVAPHNPVFIRPPWGYWNKSVPLRSAMNSYALELVGLNASGAPPWDGLEIERDAQTGEATGRFSEHAMKPTLELMFPAIPRFSHAQRISGLRRSQQVYHRFGTTAIYEGHGVAPDVMRAYQALAETGDLTMRSSLVFSPAWHAATAVPVRNLFEDWLPWLARNGIGDPTLRIAGLHLATGEESGHAFRVAAGPYTGWAGFRYDTVATRQQAREVVLEAARAGIRVTTIFADLLDLFEEADRVCPIAPLRWVCAHVDRLNHDEIARLRDLGCVVTFHPNRTIGALGAKLMSDAGTERASEIMPMRALLDAGVPFALSTDNVPVSLFHPLSHSVLRRETATGRIIAPDQALTRGEALYAATAGGAYVTFDEHRFGTIVPGMLADLAVLSDDPLTVADEMLKSLQANLTMVGGKIVSDRAADPI